MLSAGFDSCRRTPILSSWALRLFLGYAWMLIKDIAAATMDVEGTEDTSIFANTHGIFNIGYSLRSDLGEQR